MTNREHGLLNNSLEILKCVRVHWRNRTNRIYMFIYIPIYTHTHMSIKQIKMRDLLHGSDF